MPTVIITGGTGLVGKALSSALLGKGYSVIILSRQRHNPSSGANLSYANWNIRQQTIDIALFSNADYIIHLAGAGVASKRWTRKRKKEIVGSRINSSRLIVDSLKTIPNKVKAVVSASAIGWYGQDSLTPAYAKASAGMANPSVDGEGGSVRKFDEADPSANDFLGNTCKQWEESIEPVSQLGKRLVKLRTGIVLSREGGALKEFLKPLRFGIAAILGSGKQVISWIHIDDLVEMYIAAIENENMMGVYNAVAPQPVSNKELTLQLAKRKRGKFMSVHIPSFMLKIILGEMSVEILKSATVSCNKIRRERFSFLYPSLETAVKQLIQPV